MARYEILTGQFICHECKQEVSTMRWYQSIKKMTWMCKNRHVSEVNLNTKKKKADYERKE